MGVGQEHEKVFDSMAWWLHRHGVRPDHVTYTQVPVYAAMVYFGWHANDAATLWIFGSLQFLTFLIDGADGILARRTGTVSRRGHLLDEVFDITGIGITIWAVFVHHPRLSQWLIALLLVNFLVYIQNEIQGTKSITYTRGPLTGGFVLEYYFPGLLVIGTALPLVFGVFLLFTRVAWRKRFWTYYQYLTAGRRREYKATPREQRAELFSEHPALSPKRWTPSAPEPSEERNEAPQKPGGSENGPREEPAPQDKE